MSSERTHTGGFCLAVDGSHMNKKWVNYYILDLYQEDVQLYSSRGKIGVGIKLVKVKNIHKFRFTTKSWFLILCTPTFPLLWITWSRVIFKYNSLQSTSLIAWKDYSFIFYIWPIDTFRQIFFRLVLTRTRLDLV